MCIISLAWLAHPRWKLIAVSNRDELHERPADPLARWSDNNHILAGRDIKAGGTWLGISEYGRFAAITNRSEFGLPNSNLVSRGDILRDFLNGKGTYANLDMQQFSDFNPFNLLTVTNNELHIHTNRPHSLSKKLASGIYGLSNGPIDSLWPKSGHLNNSLAEWMQGQSDDPQALLEILTSQEVYHAQDSEKDKGRNLPEPKNSGIFICGRIYGTRCSTVVAIDHDGKGRMFERRYSPSCQPIGDTHLSFTWPD